MEEGSNRQQDSIVIHAFSYFPGYYEFTDEKIASSINFYNKMFCNTFNINQKDNQNGIPGILYGRYSGDAYIGGVTWA